MADSNSLWRPSASLAAIRLRAELYAQIRAFFSVRAVLEVDTPVLSRAAVSDPHLLPMTTRYAGPGLTGEVALYLQTSPEYPMKRLLAAGSGPIYQLAKAFRNGERGGRHNPEFCMLEWYRPGFDDRDLMDEVEALVDQVLGCGAIRRLSYREAFQQALEIDPHRAPKAVLETIAREQLDLVLEEADRDTWLNLLLSHLIEPRLQAPTFIYDFPASQAALARVDRDAEGQPVARRFELFIRGIEIANGYHELTDAEEQARRFQMDCAQRQQLRLPVLPVDQQLIDALASGLPDCAGVALGVDRLLMLKAGADSIDEVVAFPLERA